MNKSVNQPTVNPIIENSEDPKSDGMSSISPDVLDATSTRNLKSKTRKRRERSMVKENLHKVKHLKVS